MRNRLLQLLTDNRRGYVPMAQRIVLPQAASADGNEATVYLYDTIVSDRVTAEWWGGVCPQDFVPAFRAINADVIHLRINSPGGDVFGSEAMCQALRDHPAHVIAHVEGLCASAATNVACAADEVVMSPASKYMIHKAWSIAIGNADDMRALAAVLDKCDATMIAEYVRRSGNDTQKVTDWCAAETWFNAQETVDAGFADSIAQPAKTEAQAQARAWNLRAYLHAPKDLAGPDEPATPEPDTTEHRERQQQRLQLMRRLQIA
jgi:ATP-dependent Clp protease, protease subunit